MVFFIIMTGFRRPGCRLRAARIPLAPFVIGFVLAPVAEENQRELANSISHEIAHLLGLEHADERRSVAEVDSSIKSRNDAD